jgi:hypothetical protein
VVRPRHHNRETELPLKKDYPVKVGSMLFTLVDPHRGQETAYNRWYERDHFYAGCMIGPWLFAGKRWVATRALKDLRLPVDSPVARPVDAGSYLATYWIHADHHDEHIQWASDQVHWLYQNGRGFPERSHVHTALYNHLGAIYRDEDPVPVELAFDHHYPALAVAVMEPMPGANVSALDAWISKETKALLTGSPIATAAQWTPRAPPPGPQKAAPMDLGSAAGGAERRMQMFFLEDSPERCWEAFRRYAAAANASGVARLVFLAPFLATSVGTDKYTDQLW